MVPIHVKFRRCLKDIFDVSFRFFSTPAKEITVAKSEIHHILIIRINYRIGNMLFTTPLIDQLEEEFPKAKIDIVIGAPFTKVLFKNFKNIENIFDFDRKLLRNPFKVFAYIKRFRSKKYDMVFNLNGGSTSDRVATLITKATYKLSFCNNKIYTPTNICVKRSDFHIEHEALKPLELLKALNIKPNYSKTLTIQLSFNELLEGKKELSRLVSNFENRKIFGIFRDARYEKKFDDIFWKALVKELQKKDLSIIIVDILAPYMKAPLTDDIVGYSKKDLRELASFIANLDAFICGDTGPMHLASASGTSTIALFKATTPNLYGTLSSNDLSLVIENKSINTIVVEILHSLNISIVRNNQKIV